MVTQDVERARPDRVQAEAGRGRGTLDALEHLAGGLGTALAAATALVWVLATLLASLVGSGRTLVPGALRGLRAVADRERVRLSQWGPEVVGPGPLPTGLRGAFGDPTTRREAAWLACHATLGLLIGAFGVTLAFNAARDLTFPLWWRLLPVDEASSWVPFWVVTDQAAALGVGLVGLGWVAAVVVLAPGLAWLQALPGRRLLAPDRDADLALRVAQLTVTRAAALDAHVAELRRIERSLHDGTQNRLVAVTVLLGAARRAVARDADSADEVLDRAQAAAEQALVELRAVVRSILPPVLADRSLPDALAALAATSPVPCHLDADVPDRCAASVEATVYFAVAEALTNVARHSGATCATVTVRSRDGGLHVRVHDDGRGEADERQGSGLAGVRRRVEAHDGTVALSSPAGGPTCLELDVPCGS